MHRRLFILISSIVVLASSLCAADKQEYILNVDSTGFTFVTRNYTSPVTLDMVKDLDTGRVVDVDTLFICSAFDTVTIPSSKEMVPVTIKAPSRDIILYIWFDSTPDQMQRFADLLREYENFDNSSIAGFPDFKYSPPDDSGLVELNHKYNLDSIAGGGSDVEKAMNLMYWTHGIVRHDGSSYNPNPRNALHIIQVCSDSGRGVNCRMMATIMNEACLSVGLKVRHLTCMPYDTADTDCHVVDMIWSDSLGKWVMLDPTFRAYFENADGELLGPMEVREAYINGDSLVLNKDIDWNGQGYDAVKYRGYMAKNLFRFLTPIESSFGYESDPGDVGWVYLYPLGYRPKLVGTADTTEKTSGHMIDYYTDNAGWFWEK